MVQASTAIKKKTASSSKKRVKEKSSNTRRTYLTCCIVDDEVFNVGDSAYALEQGQTYQVYYACMDLKVRGPWAKVKLHVVCINTLIFIIRNVLSKLSSLLMLIRNQDLQLTVRTLQTRRQETNFQSSHTALVISLQDFKDERELCEVCGKIEKHVKAQGKKKEIPLLECDKCLRAFHSDCCTPSVRTIPEVDPLLCNPHKCPAAISTQ